MDEQTTRRLPGFMLGMALLFGTGIVATPLIKEPRATATGDAAESIYSSPEEATDTVDTVGPISGDRPDATSGPSAFKTATVEADFDSCKEGIARTGVELGAIPETIASDDTIHMVRFRTTDGSVIATCGAVDGRMAVTRSPY